MSYDLYFLRRRVQPALAIDDVRAYFSGREHYTIEGDAQDQALYQNWDTGIYFTFDYTDSGDPDGSSEPDDDLRYAGVSFNLNYWRPHIFGLEAEPEVRAFVEHFDLFADDPQTDGMGRGSYSSELFLAGWSTGNRFAYSAIQDELDEPPPSLPRAEIERCWDWNRRVPVLQDQLGDAYFVPPISFIRRLGGVASYVIWGDAIPTALPETDLVVLGREERHLLKRNRLTVSWMERADVDDLFAHGTQSEDGAYTLFSEWPPPEPVAAAFLAPERAIEFTKLTVDEILDAELLAETANA